MKIVLQRVREASVLVEGGTVGRIGMGLCLLVGVEKGDGPEEARYLADKVADLRIFPDPQGKMNLSLAQIQGEVLAVSQFTLAGNLTKGRRPSFDHAESPDLAEALMELFVERLRGKGFRVATGVFGAKMDVHLINEGPVTFILSRGGRGSF